MNRYYIVDGQNPAELEKKVCMFIDAGYEPIGGVTDLGWFDFENKPSCRFIVQTMILPFN
jgi:hypothetical protein